MSDLLMRLFYNIVLLNIFSSNIGHFCPKKSCRSHLCYLIFFYCCSFSFLSGPEMGKQPIKIDWETVLPEMRDNGPPLEIEVVAMVPLEGSDVANLSDHRLLESIRRLKKHLSSEISSRLSDGGAKLKALLCQMDAERNRRDRVRDPEVR